MPYALSICQASEQFKVSKAALLAAIKRGQLPVVMITVSQMRLNPKDVRAYAEAIPEWRKVNGRKGGIISAKLRSPWTGRRQRRPPRLDTRVALSED